MCFDLSNTTLFQYYVIHIIYNVYTGREPDPKVLKDMVNECPEKLNFTHFLSLFGNQVSGKGAS